MGGRGSGRKKGSKSRDWIDPTLRYVVRGECWLWSPRCYATGEPASNDPRVPGQYRRPEDGHTMLACRYVWEVACLRRSAWEWMDESGRLLPEVYVWQTCGDRRCIRPEHLRAGLRPEWRAAVAERHRVERGRAGASGDLKNWKWSVADGLLTAAQVATIRDPARTVSDAALALEYGVHETTVRACRLGKTYRRFPMGYPMNGSDQPTDGVDATFRRE